MSRDKQSQSEEPLDLSRADELHGDGQRPKAKRDWVEWGKTAQKATEDFMPGRIEDNPLD